MSDWKSLALKVPGQDLLESARAGLETILVFLEIIKAILETIKIFLIDFGNPVRVLVEALLALIKSLFETLKQSGFYAYYDIPNPLKDPNFARHAGGYQAFISRFKSSLYDSRDPNRPQPTPGGTKSGFVLLVLDAQELPELITKVQGLLRFFGKGLSSPQYAAPVNARVIPVGSKNDPILAVPKIFGADIKGLAVEWSLPTTTNRADGGFGGLISSTIGEFIPPKFLIEKTTVPNGELVTYDQQTPFESKTGKRLKRKEKARDEYGDVFRKFEEYIVLSPTSNSASFFISQHLGTFRYVDTNIEKDKTYYYRVRAFSGDLDVAGLPANFSEPKEDPATRTFMVHWPSTSPKSPPTMGRPTGILSGRVPTIPNDIDIIDVLNAVFRTAYALGFHLTPAKTDLFDASGLPANPGTPVTEIGKGTLMNLAGPLGSNLINPQPLLPAQASQPDPITGLYPMLPHFYRGVRYQSARLANSIASSMLENSAVGSFRDLMRSPAPHPLVGAKGYLQDAVTLEDMVVGFTHPNGNNSDFNATTYDPRVYDTYSYAFSSADVRRNMVLVVDFLKSFSLSGAEPDWVRVSLLRDILPWSGQFIYELLDKIDALLAAFNSILDEIVAFINLIERKIDLLEEFIEYLISILDFIESLQFAVAILSVPSVDGGIPDWITNIDSAGGAKPTSGAGSYTAGVCLAYVAPDIAAFKTAFSIIF